MKTMIYLAQNSRMNWVFDLVLPICMPAVISESSPRTAVRPPRSGAALRTAEQTEQFEALEKLFTVLAAVRPEDDLGGRVERFGIEGIQHDRCVPVEAILRVLLAAPEGDHRPDVSRPG